MIIFTVLCLWSVIFYFCVRRLYSKPIFTSNKLPKCKVNKITKKIVISIPEQTELKCPVTGDKLTKDNTHTCSCGTSYSKDVVYSKYITKCEYCSKKFEFNKPLRIYVTNENNDERLLNRALRYKIIEREGYLCGHKNFKLISIITI